MIKRLGNGSERQSRLDPAAGSRIPQAPGFVRCNDQPQRTVCQHHGSFTGRSIRGPEPTRIRTGRAAKLADARSSVSQNSRAPRGLAFTNMFGLIREPLRTAWQGPNITWFARVCCDIAKLYGSLFALASGVGLVSSVRSLAATKLQHLPHGLPRQTKLARSLPNAQAVHLDGSSYACIHFHLVHLLVSDKTRQPCNVRGWKCGGLLLDRHKTPLPRRFVVHYCSAVYPPLRLLNGSHGARRQWISTSRDYS